MLKATVVVHGFDRQDLINQLHEIVYAIRAEEKKLGFIKGRRGSMDFFTIEGKAEYPDVYLPPVVWSVLKAAGINSTEDILKHCASDLLRTPGIGYARLLHIKRGLEEAGLTIPDKPVAA